eukprot:scpid92745/ scgid0699/ 
MAKNTTGESTVSQESEDAFRDRINLDVIKRTDSLARKILFTSDSSCLFIFNTDTEVWVKQESIAGPVFVYERGGDSLPRYAFMILSTVKRLEQEFFEYVSPQMTFSKANEMNVITYQSHAGMN